VVRAPPGLGVDRRNARKRRHRQRTGFSVVAIRRGEETIDSPDADTSLAEGDTLIGIGTRENCEAFEEMLADN